MKISVIIRYKSNIDSGGINLHGPTNKWAEIHISLLKCSF